MDASTLQFLIDSQIFSLTNYSNNFLHTIHNKEILMSKLILLKNWNIGCLLKKYKNIDFTNIKQFDLSKCTDVMLSKYHNIEWNEYELVFIKGNRIKIKL